MQTDHKNTFNFSRSKMWVAYQQTVRIIEVFLKTWPLDYKQCKSLKPIWVHVLRKSTMTSDHLWLFHPFEDETQWKMQLILACDFLPPNLTVTHVLKYYTCYFATGSHIHRPLYTISRLTSYCEGPFHHPWRFAGDRLARYKWLVAAEHDPRKF